MRPLLLPTVLILAWVLHHNIKKNKSNDKETVDSYLRRESKANETRRQDISNLDYLQVPLELFPFDITLNDEKMQSKIVEYGQIIKDCADTKMLNLIGISNLELKEKYGPANLEQLGIYDQNYGKYIKTASMFADCIMEKDISSAVKIWEHLIAIGTDISSTYYNLGSYYMAHDDTNSFDSLYDAIPDPSSIAGKVITNKLNELKG